MSGRPEFSPALVGILLLETVPCADTFACTDGCPVSGYDSPQGSIHFNVLSGGASHNSSPLNSYHFRLSVSQTAAIIPTVAPGNERP